MRRGEIWWVELEPVVGCEMQKTRPAVIVSVDGIGKLPLRIVVPLTDWDNKFYEYRWMVFISNDNGNGLSKIVAADCLHIRSLDTTRFRQKIGDIREDHMEDILAAISITLGLP